MSNYLSLNAVQKGVKFAQSSSPEINRRLQNLVDVGQQLNIDKPALYPLFHAAISADLRKNKQLAEKYIDLCVRYTIELSGLTGTRSERSKSMKPIDTMTVRGQSSQFSLGSTLVDTASLESLKMEYGPASPDKSVDMAGVWVSVVYGAYRYMRGPVVLEVKWIMARSLLMPAVWNSTRFPELPLPLVINLQFCNIWCYCLGSNSTPALKK